MHSRSLLCFLALAYPAFAAAPATAPYPPSPVIREIRWAPVPQIIRRGVAPDGSDCWPLTWAEDGDLYTAYGDGFGFEPFIPKKVSLGVAKVSGLPPDFHGINLRTPSNEWFGNGKVGRKASGMLMVDGVLYMLARNLGNSQMAWSRDHGATWTWADWKFTTSFGCPTFLNFGQNYAGARDRFVYVYSPDENGAYGAADRMVLARVPQDRIREQSAYEFFAGTTADDGATWTKDISQRAAVFTNPGHCYRGGIAYDPALRRYLWCQILPESTNAGGPRFQGGFGVYDAPEPWGPWTTAYYCPVWDVGPGESSNFPTKWMAADGRSAWLVFSGNDNFSVRHAEFVLNDGQLSP
jgi:hypothetical protein